MMEDVELCLEVQVDPDSKRILSNPEKCRSTLLDVTVLKPKELEAFGTQRTNTLRASEVRKLISSLERQRRKKQKVLDKLKHDDTIVKVRKHEDYNNHENRSRKHSPSKKETFSPIDDLERKDFIGITESVEPLFCEIRRSLKNVETRITNMQDINLMISQTTVNETASEEYIAPRPKRRRSNFSKERQKNSSVYRVETAPRDLRSILVCENKRRDYPDDKIEGKCLCENCGIVGLLMECQKHPLLSELSESPSGYKEFKNRRKKTRFFAPNFEKSTNLSGPSYIEDLVKRIQILEERLAEQEEKVVPKDYFKEMMSKMANNFSSKTSKVKSNIALPLSDKLQNSTKAPKTQSQEAIAYYKATCTYNNNKNDKSTITEDDGYNGFVWRWGEEILRPGIDLKNRIVTLLQEILSKFSLRERSSPSNVLERDRREYNSDTFKKFMEQMNTKVFNAHVDPKGKLLTNYNNVTGKEFDSHRISLIPEKYRRSEDPYEKMRTPREQHPKKENAKNVDVSYVNPKVLHWQKDIRNEHKGRQEFLKIASKAKQYQKDILWKNIWSQAKANGQSRDDKITIKIPIPSKTNKTRQEMFETELTIGEVEAVLKNR